MTIEIEPGKKYIKMQLENFKSVRAGIWDDPESLKKAAKATVKEILEDFCKELFVKRNP